jgi:hypothetical protein
MLPDEWHAGRLGPLFLQALQTNGASLAAGVRSACGGLPGAAWGTEHALWYGSRTGALMGESLPVLGFCLALSIITRLIAGMVPAWLASRTDPMASMRGASRTMGGGAGLPQGTMVVVQTAISLVPVAMAAMLAHSIYNLRNQDFGFHTENREIVTIEPPLAKYRLADLDRLYRELKVKLEALPGVRSASVALDSPMCGHWFECPIGDASLLIQVLRHS